MKRLANENRNAAGAYVKPVLNKGPVLTSVTAIILSGSLPP
jgi:hypothetical protein